MLQFIHLDKRDWFVPDRFVDPMKTISFSRSDLLIIVCLFVRVCVFFPFDDIIKQVDILHGFFYLIFGCEN